LRTPKLELSFRPERADAFPRARFLRARRLAQWRNLSSIECTKRGPPFLSFFLSFFLSQSPKKFPLGPRVLSPTALIRPTTRDPKAETCPVGCCDAQSAVSNFLIAPSHQKPSSKPIATPSVSSSAHKCPPTARAAAAPPAKKTQSSSPSNSSTSTTAPTALRLKSIPCSRPKSPPDVSAEPRSLAQIYMECGASAPLSRSIPQSQPRLRKTRSPTSTPPNSPSNHKKCSKAQIVLVQFYAIVVNFPSREVRPPVSVNRQNQLRTT
jgi:hypothetical protein